MLHDLAAWEVSPNPPQLSQSALETDVFVDNPKLHILIATNSYGENIGFLSYYQNYSSWEGATGLHIGDLWVSPGWRRHGVATKLLNRVTDANRLHRIDVFVVKDNNARFFYERLGFEEQTQWTIYRLHPIPGSVGCFLQETQVPVRNPALIRERLFHPFVLLAGVLVQ